MKKLLFTLMIFFASLNAFAQYQNQFIAVVTDYGAVGNGTTDNLTAFNAAVADVAAHGGGTVWIPIGNFKVSGLVTTHHTNTMFTGDKGAIVHFTSNSTVGGFDLVHDSCAVVGLNIRGAGTSSGNIANGTPIFIFGASYCKILNNTISGAGGNGIEVNSNMSARKANYNQIIGNTIVNPKGTLTDNAGIMIGYSTLFPLVGNQVSKNVIQGNQVLSKGILMLGVGYGNIFDKNEINNVNTYGIILYVTPATPDIPDNAMLLRDNHITNNKIYYVGLKQDTMGTTNFGAGIYVQQAYRSIITNNTIRKAGMHSLFATLPIGGIAVGNSSGTIVSNNIIDSCTAVPGINVANLFLGGSITNNHVYNSKLGVQVANSNGVNILGNHFLTISTTGINISADTAGWTSRPIQYRGALTGYNFNISENIVQSVAGVFMVGTTYDTLSNIKIINNNIRSTYANGGIYLTYFRNGQVIGNTVNNSSATYGILINGGSGISVNNDINFNQLYNTTAYTVGINTASAAHSVTGNYINSATTQLSIAGTTYNANENLINGLVLETSDAVNTASNANYTITSSNQLVKLPVITAGRTVSIPSAAAFKGRRVHIWNQNTAAFNWSFTGATVKDAANNTLTNLTNTAIYIIESDGTNWVKIN